MWFLFVNGSRYTIMYLNNLYNLTITSTQQIVIPEQKDGLTSVQWIILWGERRS